MIINCIIIEDEPLAQNLLQDYIEKVDFLSLQKTFNNPIEAIPYLKGNDIDLIFLDIEMPKLSGMDLLDVLENNPKIIFTTAYSSYAVKSYEKNALDYLLKPITFERFLTAVNKFPTVNKEKFTLDDKTEDNSIFIKSEKNLIRLNYNEIIFIEGLKDYVVFHTGNTKHIVYHTLKKLEEKLPNNFMRAHNSYIINLSKVKKLKDNHIYIIETKIPISNKYRDNILKNINKKLL
jgi:DNA-binding LytR/AlgR family response regulator